MLSLPPRAGNRQQMERVTQSHGWKRGSLMTRGGKRDESPEDRVGRAAVTEGWTSASWGGRRQEPAGESVGGTTQPRTRALPGNRHQQRRQQQRLAEGHTSSYGLRETWSRAARPRLCRAWAAGCTRMTGSGAPVFQRKPLTHRSLSWSPRRMLSMTEIFIRRRDKVQMNHQKG